MNAALDAIRGSIRSVITAIARGLNTATGGKLSPHFVTIFGLCMHFPIALLIASGDFISAAILLVIFGLFDTLDGALARIQNRESKTGMLLDSITDRIKEILLYTSAAYYFVSIHDAAVAVWAVAACGAALLVSYTNAWGEVVTTDTHKPKPTNQTFRGGIMSYDMRIFTLVVGLLLQRLDIALIIIFVLSVVTALDRLDRILKRLR